MAVVDLSHLRSTQLLCAHLDVLPRHATYAATHMDKQVAVHEIITNRGRKKRKIYAPSRMLKYLQTQIRDQMLDRVPVEPCVHGFVPGRGCLTNAQAHMDSRTIVNIDLKDFFPSIKRRRVFGMITKVFGLEPGPCMLMARLMTYDDHLCQGFVTSPDVANMAAWRLDRRLQGLAKSMDLRYTRYADDLTFSGDDWSGNMDKFVDIVRGIVESEKFKVNDKKIAVMRRGRRQKVTGLVVGKDTVRVPRRIRRLIRSAVHHWPQQTPERRAAITGWISYINCSNPQEAAKLRAAIVKAESDESRTWNKNVQQNKSFDSDVISLSQPRRRR